MTIRLTITIVIILASGIALYGLAHLIAELVDRWRFGRDLDRWIAELDAERERASE